MSRYYLGIDGGQSSTTAFLADETGHVRGAGRGGPCNHVTGREGREKFMHAVGGCVDEACRQAHIDPATIVFASVCLGFSGGSADKESYTRELIRSHKYRITHDADIALSGATAGAPGLLVIAGTGSIAFGRNASGASSRAGGWGYAFGDEGGGYDLTRRALRAALRFEEGWGPATSLHAFLLDATGAADANALMHLFYTPDYTRRQIASLARLVTQAAEAGDDVARRILLDAAVDLAGYAGGVYHRLFRDDEHPPVAHVGGVFHSQPLRAEFVRLIAERLACVAGPPHFGPTAGALLEALRADGNQSALAAVPESEK